MALLVVGVAGATTRTGPILTAGLAGLVAGAVSMALGEYVSLAALAVTGYVSARLGGARPGRAMGGLVIGGAVAMAVTFGIGALVGTTVG